MNIEVRKSRVEFEQPAEIGRTLISRHPEAFELLQAQAVPIEQVYLSVPGEACSLRVQETITPDGPAYSATLKADRTLDTQDVSRFECETKQLSPAAYRYYADNPDLPRVRKLRANMAPGITIDRIEGISSPLIEIEQGKLTPDAALLIDELLRTSIDVSHDTAWDNDQVAYRLSGLAERPLPEAIDPVDVANGMVADIRSGQRSSITTISGMSGSGKTTLAQQVAAELSLRYPDLPAPIVLSTDDYHRGAAYLESAYGAPWTNWDAAEVYDTALLAEELKKLRIGTPLQRRQFDFTTQEPVLTQIVQPSPFVIIEGIRAATPDLDGTRTRHYALPTPVATCLLRDTRRVMERPSASIGSPEQRLRYMLEIGLPTYLAQHQPPRERYSESVRPIGSTALE